MITRPQPEKVAAKATFHVQALLQRLYLAIIIIAHCISNYNTVSRVLHIAEEALFVLRRRSDAPHEKLTEGIAYELIV